MTKSIYRDALGNRRSVEVVFDDSTGSYVAGIRSGRYTKMMDGVMRQVVSATGEGQTMKEAVAAAEDFYRSQHG